MSKLGGKREDVGAGEGNEVCEEEEEDGVGDMGDHPVRASLVGEIEADGECKGGNGGRRAVRGVRNGMDGGSAIAFVKASIGEDERCDMDGSGAIGIEA